MVINNPRGAHTFVSDFRTGRGDDGRIIEYGMSTVSLRAETTVKRGDVVALIAPTQTVPLSVSPATDPGTAGFRVVGVALADTAAGDLVRICTSGHCLVTAGATMTVSQAVVAHPSNAGRATTVTPDATTVSGAVLGTCLASGAANTLVPIWLRLTA